MSASALRLEKLLSALHFLFKTIRRFIFLQLLCHIHLTEYIEQRLSGIAKKSVRWYNRRCSIPDTSLSGNGEKFDLEMT